VALGKSFTTEDTEKVPEESCPVFSPLLRVLCVSALLTTVEINVPVRDAPAFVDIRTHVVPGFLVSTGSENALAAAG
jgi:hypothetical protein